MRVAGVLALATLLVPSVGCSRTPDPVTPSAETLALGERLYDEWGCAACHGPDRAGTENAPPLTAASDHWTVDAFAKYLLDPQSVVASDPRLSKIGEAYADMEMPPFDFPLEEREAVTAWVIEASR